jgi:hypothetical protein
MVSAPLLLVEVATAKPPAARFLEREFPAPSTPTIVLIVKVGRG